MTYSVAGRLGKLRVGTIANPAADYESVYGYDGLGRLNSVTGPGLPAGSGGVKYTFAPNSDFVDETKVMSDLANPSSVIGSAKRTYESLRDLVTSVENKWGSTTISKYAYRNDELGRRTDVTRTGTAFAAPHFERWGYNARNELTSAERFQGNDPATATPMPVNPPVFRAYDYDLIGNRTTTSQPLATTCYSNNLNQYTQINEIIAPPDGVAMTYLTYDFEGNLTNDGKFT